MIKIARIVENADFRTVDIHLKEKSYSIKVAEKEIDTELEEKHGINPLRQKLYATPVAASRNILATDIAERKLLEILEDELLDLDSRHEYQVKNASDWDSTRSHANKLSENLDNNSKYWRDAKEKYMMIDGKYLFHNGEK